MIDVKLFGYPLWLLLAVPVWLLLRHYYNQGEPTSLPNYVVPFVGNTYQFAMDNAGFTARASVALQKTNIVTFYLGLLKVHLVSGQQNVQAMFRKPAVLSNRKFMLMAMEKVMYLTKEDVAKFANDDTGRTLDKSGKKQYWASLHHVLAEHLARRAAIAPLAVTFVRFFGEKIETQPVGEWETVHLYHFMRLAMGEAAVASFAGRRMLERNPDFLKAFHDYEMMGPRLMYSLPEWMDPEPHRRVKRVRRMFEDFLHWDPVLGSRLMRAHMNWGKEVGLSLESRAGFYTGFMIGLNGNTIPAATWTVFELVKDPSLWRAVQEETTQAFDIDADTGEHKVNVQAHVALPLLQSIYIEILRLHVSINITREVLQETTVAGYKLSRKTLLQAPTRVAHLDERCWGVEGHPASEFWASRNIKIETTIDETGKTVRTPEFVMKGRPDEFFPYGGGVSICPGRHFAKQEIMAAVGLVVARFDVEFVEWTSEDLKTKSDRPAHDDRAFAGSGAMPPDKDMKIRWKRRW